MKIANADKLKKHFENVVDVKLFTVPNILTIIDTFSSEVDEHDLISRSELKKHKVRSTERHEYVVPVYDIDNAPSAIGGTEP